MEVFERKYSEVYSDKRRMDIFIPENPNGKGLFFVHGGGWVKGDKSQWHSVARYFCNMGYSCASAGYRLAPDSKYPSQIEDVRLAMSYFKEHAEEFKFDPDKVTAVGSSAGGHLVLMLATIDSTEQLGQSSEMKNYDTRPNAVVCYCPVCTVHMSPELWIGREVPQSNVPALMDKPEEDNYELYSQASPIDRIKGNEPPVLLVHGDADTLVPLIQSETLHKKCIEKGVYSELHILKGVNHGFGYGVETDAQKEALRCVTAFLEEQGDRSAVPL